MKKKILIGGCSFSQTQYWPNKDYRQGQWIPWTDLLNNEYSNQFEIINVAKSSFGQSKIVESLLEQLFIHNFEIDYVIVQWSAVSRAYSIDEKDFTLKILKHGEIDFYPYIHEYMIDGSKIDNVTTLVNRTSLNFYIASLNQIFLMKTLLEQKNIQYKMFWGWNQINQEIELKLEHLLKSIYKNNFWIFKDVNMKNGGMFEYIVQKIGRENGLHNDGFHPSSTGQKVFYEDIIKKVILKEFINYNNTLI